MKIRPMEIKDLEEVAAIEAASFTMPWSKDSFEASLMQDNYHLLVVEDEETGEICGYSAYIGVLDEAEIPNVCIRADRRGQHLGEMMLNALINEAKENGIKTIFLEVRESNEPAKGLYTKLGFKQIAIRKNFYEKPVENAWVMNLIV